MQGPRTRGPRRPPTIRDVARHAGVSVATVSRVLNEIPVVRSEVRERVRAAIAELGYRPSSTARNLSLGRSQAIGVVAPFFTTPSVVERLRGVVGARLDHGYGLMLFDVETPDQRAGAFRDFARLDRVDGLLVISLPLYDDEVTALERDHLPVVMVDIGHPRVPHVVTDDVRGGELAAEHLISRGHRRIGFVGDLPPSPFGFTSSEHRREGFRRALRRAGIEPDRRDRAARQPRPRGGARARGGPPALRRPPDRGLRRVRHPGPRGARGRAVGRARGARRRRRDRLRRHRDRGRDRPHARCASRCAQSGARGADLLLAAIAGAEAPEGALEPLAVVARRTT